MNVRIYLMSIVAVLILIASPVAIGKIDPDTVAGMWLFEEGGGDVARIVPMQETMALLQDRRNGKMANSEEHWNSMAMMSMLKCKQMTASFLKNSPLLLGQTLSHHKVHAGNLS